MAVPDWPTSYGYNMFFLPLEKWWRVGGIHDEHLHRLVASSVGALTLGLALWLQLDRAAVTVRRLGWIAVGLVIFQGLLGGLRVVLDKEMVAGTTLGTVFGVAHGMSGQTFFALLGVIAWLLFQLNLQPSAPRGAGSDRFPLPHIGAALILGQLALGAMMRHQHAGLAITDFPLAYGQLWPSVDADSIARYNQLRTDDTVVTASQIILQILHRCGAVAIVATVGAAFFVARRRFGTGSTVARAAAVWLALISAQFLLGAATIWTRKSADVATAHVAVGALSLLTACVMILIARGRVIPASVSPPSTAVSLTTQSGSR
jgi:cytochrome c oxidase assembly protein subunit 15